MTDLSAEFKALAEYRPTNKVRFVTAASLFDGHDAAIGIMRRILQSMGASRNLIQRIFLSEGMLLGAIGTGIGLLLAVIICLVQLKYHLIHLTGGSFLIDYFPVKLIWTDFLLVTGTALLITILASGIPARKAGRQQVSLR